MKLMRIVCGFAVAVLLFGQADVALQKAIRKEQVEGDIRGAIQQYAAVAAKYAKTDRATAAMALVHEAQAYQKLGDAQANRIYEQLVKDYADQKDALAEARAHLGGPEKAAVAAGPATRVVVSTYDSQLNHSALAPSPDGRYLLETSADGLSLRDLRTGQTRSLSKGQTVMARFSPDGRRIALMRWIDQTPEAWIVTPDGSGLRKLWQGEKGRWTFLNSWFPDNQRFLVEISLDAQNHRLSAISATDGATTNLWEGVRPGGYGLMSPDGNYVNFNQRISREPVKDELRLLSLADKRESVLLSDFGPAVRADWTPDGKGLVFLSDRRKPGDARDLWYLAVANGQPQGRPQLVRSDFGDHAILSPITPEGGLYYVQNADMREVLSVPIDQATGKAMGSPVRISGEGAGPAGQGIYSPDGKWLTYIRAGTGPSIHVFRNLATGEERNVNTGFIGGREQKWFPDSQSLLVDGLPGTQEPRGLYRVNAQTGAATLLKVGSFGASFAISPDGKTVYYSQRLASETQTRVMAWEIETGKERELLRGDGLGPTHWIGITLSPDGKQLATARIDGAEHVLELQSADGGSRREIYRVRDPEVIQELEWNPDGSYLTFAKVTQYRTSLWRIPVTGGAPQEMGISSRAMGKISLHPDGHHIAFIDNQSVSEVMSLENFLPKTTPAGK